MKWFIHCFTIFFLNFLGFGKLLYLSIVSVKIYVSLIKIPTQIVAFLFCLVADIRWQIMMSTVFVFQVSLRTAWTNIFATMRVCHMTQKPCTTVTREPSGLSLHTTGLCTWTSMHMEGEFECKHTKSTYPLIVLFLSSSITSQRATSIYCFTLCPTLFIECAHFNT